MSKKPAEAKTIEVFLRVRPLVGREIAEGDTTNNLVLDPTDPGKVTVSQPTRSGVAPRTFNFHRAFGPNSTQKEVYERFAQKAVTSALDGYHGVLFVFGQTGSGKSFTISNDGAGNEGMLQRCVADVFSRVQEDSAHEYTICVSYVQLYNEILTDLLEAASGGLNNHVKLVGVSDVNSDLTLMSERTGEKIGQRVRDKEEALELYYLGSGRKEMAKTKMNETSSRSHCIFTMEISRRPKAGATAKAADGGGAPPRALEGKLILCDLAGSERVMKTGAKGQQLVEAASINSSLLVLGKVVSALTEKSVQHVPFRESKLTRMLQYSLSGYGKTSIVVNVSPSDYNTEETLSAIMFGQRAIQIKEQAQQHVILDYKALYLQLQSQLDKQLESAVESALQDERREHQLEIRDLKARIKELEQERDLLSAGGKKSSLTAAGSSSSGDAGAPSSTGGGGDEIVQQLDALRKSHESNLSTVTGERDTFRAEVSDLKQRLSQTESCLFAVAKKFEAFRLTAAAKQQAWLAKMNEMAAEVAAVKKCDFISIDNLEDGLSIPGLGGPSTPSTPALVLGSRAGAGSASAGGGGDVDEEQLDRAYLVIQALQQERQSLIVYQHKAKLAIRMLYHELQEYKQQPHQPQESASNAKK